MFHYLENTHIYFRDASSSDVYRVRIASEGVSFSQSFREKTFKQKTLQRQNYTNKQGVIKQANPGNFSFSIPVVFDSAFFDIILSKITNDTTAFTVWFLNENKAFCADTCVVTGCNISPKVGEVLLLEIEGEFAKLWVGDNTTSVTGFNFSNIVTNQSDFPTFSGSAVVAETATEPLVVDKYIVNQNIAKQFISTTDAANSFVTGASMEIRRDIDWVENLTIADSMSIRDSSNEKYPENFVVLDTTVSGNIRNALALEDSYWNDVTEHAANQKFHEDGHVTLGAVDENNRGLVFSGSQVAKTSRVNTGAYLSMNTDWRYKGIDLENRFIKVDNQNAITWNLPANYFSIVIGGTPVTYENGDISYPARIEPLDANSTIFPRFIFIGNKLFFIYEIDFGIIGGVVTGYGISISFLGTHTQDIWTELTYDSVTLFSEDATFVVEDDVINGNTITHSTWIFDLNSPPEYVQPAVKTLTFT